MATAMHDAAAYTSEVAQDVASSTRNAARTVSNEAQNVLTRAQNEANAEDTVRIHDEEGQAPRHPVQQAFDYQHVVKEATRWGVAEHDVSFSGFGGLIFIVMLFALVLAVTSFAGTSWSTAPTDGSYGNREETGLWETCTCSHDVPDESWFVATQAMITIGFLASWVAMAAITLYMCMCLNLIKKTFLLIAVLISTSLSVLFVFIGIVVYGASNDPAHGPGWSYVMAVFSMVLTFAAGILAFLHLRRSVAI